MTKIDRESVDISRERLEHLQKLGMTDYLHMALRAALDEAEAERDRLRAEEREACFTAAEYVSDGRIAALQADSAEADDPYGDGLFDEAVSLSEAMLAAIRARGET